MLSRGSGAGCILIGVIQILMGLHMAGHDSSSAWWLIADLFMCVVGMIEIVVGYILITED